CSCHSIRPPPPSTLFPYTTLFRSNSSADRRLLMNWSAAGRAASSVFAGSVGTRSSLNVSRLVSSVVPRLAGEFSTSGAADHSGRSEERRVGKEGRGGWGQKE